jgi:uncharacterized membrane protein
MTMRSPHLQRGRSHHIQRHSKVPRWLFVILVAAMLLSIAVGIYIGMHTRVFGPDY